MRNMVIGLFFKDAIVNRHLQFLEEAILPGIADTSENYPFNVNVLAGTPFYAPLREYLGIYWLLDLP